MDERHAANGTHRPVLFDEVMAALDVKSNGQYIDATLGGGGHAEGILERSRPSGQVLGLDRDPQAITFARQHLQKFSERLIAVNSTFANVGEVARANGFTEVEGILLDLGLSSLQLANAERGFSFLSEGPLDMRFDPAHELTAGEIVNHGAERDIADVIYRYSEEPRSRQIARAIVHQRPLRTTKQLADVIARTTRGRGRIHPATRTFQALRIAVNDEFAEIERALPQTIELLKPGGRLAIISFHSLEDRIIKNFMRAQQQAGAVSLVNKKPITASDEELIANPRSRSAKLRVATRN